MGGRKFFYGVLIAILGYIAMFFGKISAPEWKDLVVWCFAIFSTANVASNVADMMKSKDKSEK